MAAKSLKCLVERLMVNQVGVIRPYLPVHAPIASFGFYLHTEADF